MARRILILSVSLLLSISSLWAGGWNNTLMGCRALALGGAFVAVADDPSAIFHNPAGLVFQEKKFNLAIDGFYINPTHEYVMTDGSRAESHFKCSLPQFFLTYKTNDRLTLGLGFYVPYAGGGMSWEENELGYPFKSTLGIYSITPTLSYQISQQLSVGFNLNLYSGVMNVDMVDPEMAIPVKIEERGSTFSAGFGLLFKPSEKLTVGLGVRGSARMKLSGETIFTVTDPVFGSFQLKRDSETRFNIPWDIELGFSYRITDNFLVTTSAQYTMWSALDKVEKMIYNLPGEGDRYEEEVMNFRDILIARVGVEYIVSGGLILRGGIGFDRYATPEETLNFKNIDVNKFSLLGGIGYRTGNTQIDFVYVHANGKEREKWLVGVPNPERYNLSATIMGIGVTFSF